MTILKIGSPVLASAPAPAWAHASEQGFVLLLPTDIYTGAGVAVVALTVLLLAILPAWLVKTLYLPVVIARTPRLPRLTALASWLSFLLLVFLIWAGLNGPRAPLSNPLPLSVWTVFWIGFFTVQAVLGDIWRYVNPWTGPHELAQAFGLTANLTLPPRAGYWPALISFGAFALFLLVDIAPSDPERLGVAVAAYWTFHMVAVMLFGPRWLFRGEGISAALFIYSRISLFGRRGGRIAIGLPGWKLAARGPMPLGLALLALILLGVGSFDGLNETFWWLARLGMNPLEFSGRSAVVWQNTLGLIAANAALVAVFVLTLALGLRLAGQRAGLVTSFRLFAPTLLPIALGYHIAHYLPSFMVDIQWTLVALSDPLMLGTDLLGLGEFYVTTGFFNTQASVRVIFLSQAAAVVAGHVLAVMLAHVLATRHFGSARAALLSQMPLSLFMIGYTFFGLWLLASPRF